MPLDLDDFGKIPNWPKGFFGDEMEEIFATSKAVFNRTKPPTNGN